jgi:hypothetical protein
MLIDQRNTSLVIKAIAHATGQTYPRTGTPQRDSEPRADPRCLLPCPGTGATVNLGLPAVRSEVHLSGDTVNDQPNGEFSTWSIERLEAHAATLARGGKGHGNGRPKEPCP